MRAKEFIPEYQEKPINTPEEYNPGTPDDVALANLINSCKLSKPMTPEEMKKDLKDYFYRG